MDEKKRYRVHIDPTPYHYVGPGTTAPGPAFTFPPIKSLETTLSRGHAWPSAGPAKTDLGGDFTTTKVTRLDVSDLGSYRGSGFGYEYRGQEFAISPWSAISDALASVVPSSDQTLMGLGTKAIARSLPTNPVVSGATFLGELKSGLPRLIGKELFKTRLKDYRKVGSEYLNVEFGWKPIVSDLMAFGKATIDSEKIIAQLHRDSGKNIHRKYTFPDEVTYVEGDNINRASAIANGSTVYPYCYKSASGATLRITKQVTTKTWFSGCFTYHLNLGTTLTDKVEQTASRMRKLYGLEITPEVAWNLAPWSWAADWEGSIGDGLHNVSRFSQDGLVMRYGYIMQQKTAVVTYTLPFQGRLDTSPETSLTMTITSQSKVRRRATPFGFGFDMKALNGRQLSILGALGISRGPRHL